MLTHVRKRDGQHARFNPDKIERAVVLAMRSQGEEHEDHQLAARVTDAVLRELDAKGLEVPSVDEIHQVVENTLMDFHLHDVARAYITYRAGKKPNIFRPRSKIKPAEYPALLAYVDAIRRSYWTHEEFNFEPDVNDVQTLMTPAERTAALRAMLAISQIESAVKTFWGTLHQTLPKPEIAKVGATFAESEVRHEDTYSHLIEIMGLQDSFDTLHEVPAIGERIRYLEKVNRTAGSRDPRDVFERLVLFSTFIENVSLFSQFYVLMALNAKHNYLKGTSNGIEATSKEENLHAQFGFELVDIIKHERPEWWTEDFRRHVVELTREAYTAEFRVLSWIYEAGDVDAAPFDVVDAYVRQRLNDSLEAIGIDPIFEVDERSRRAFQWFEDETALTKQYDFFDKRPTTYTKRVQAFDPDAMFED